MKLKLSDVYLMIRNGNTHFVIDEYACNPKEYGIIDNVTPKEKREFWKFYWSSDYGRLGSK